MKRTFLSLTILVIAAFLVGMALGQKTTDASAEVRKVIEAYNADLGRYYASGDVDSIVSVFAEDARQMPPNGPALEGREKMRAFWRQAVSWGQWNFALTTVSVTAHPPLAVELGKYRLQFTPGQAAPPGMKASLDTGNYVCYWRLDNDGKWRVVYDIATSEMNAQAELEKQVKDTVREVLGPSLDSLKRYGVKKTNEMWLKAVTERNIAQVMEFYAEDAVWLVPKVPIMTGKDAIRKFWEADFAGPDYGLTWKLIKIDVSESIDIASSFGTWSGKTKDEKGNTQAIGGYYVVIWKKKPYGTWKVAIDIHNN
jgi:ketosteroid isomerase-like protein